MLGYECRLVIPNKVQGRWVNFAVDGPFSINSHYDIMIYPIERKTKDSASQSEA